MDIPRIQNDQSPKLLVREIYRASIIAAEPPRQRIATEGVRVFVALSSRPNL